MARELIHGVNYSLVRDVEISSLTTSPLCFEYDPDPTRVDGTVHPPHYLPLLVAGEAGYELALGVRWLHSLEIRGAMSIPQALLLDSGEGRDVLSLLIALKSGMRNFNVVERARALAKVRDAGGGADGSVLHMLDVPQKEEIIRRYEILATAPEEILALAAGETLHLTTVFEIFRFDRPSWVELAHFIVSLSLGTRKRNEILSMMYDIARRDEKPVASIVAEPALRRILSSGMDPPRRGESVYGCVWGMRYPVMREYRERFLAQLKKTGIEREFHLQLPRDFERWEFRLGISFTSGEEFAEKVRRLREIGESESFSRLMAMRG
jgi:hypothetical protein